VITHLVQTIYVGYDIASIPLDLRCFFGSETKFIIEASGNKYFIDPDDLGGIIDFLTLCKNTRKQWEDKNEI